VKELVQRVAQAEGVEEVAPVLPLADAQKRPRQNSAYDTVLSDIKIQHMIPFFQI
jgi:hypothetical protein